VPWEKRREKKEKKVGDEDEREKQFIAAYSQPDQDLTAQKDKKSKHRKQRGKGKCNGRGHNRDKGGKKGGEDLPKKRTRAGEKMRRALTAKMSNTQKGLAVQQKKGKKRRIGR